MTSHADLSEPNGTTIDRRASSGPAPPVGGLPDFLTVVEAARLLRIGRTSPYVLAQRWLYTDGREGLPVVRVGRQLRVPRRALEGLASGELTAAVHPSSAPAVEAPEPSTRLPDDDDARTGAKPHTTDRVPLASPRSDAVIHDEHDRAVGRAARGLGQLSGRHTPPPEIVQKTSTLLDHIDQVRVPGRWTAMRGLLVMARHVSFDDKVRQRLLGMLESEAGVRGDVAVALAHQDVQDARPVIETHLLQDPSSRLQVKLLGAIEILGVESSLPSLLSLAESPLETATARALIRALGAIPDERAHLAVLRLARGADVGVRQDGFNLLPVEHPLRLDLALAGLSDTAAPVRRRAALALSDRRDLVDALETALENEYVPEVREAISAAIATAREAPPLEQPPVPAGLTPGLLARVPVAAGTPGDAIRLVALDAIGRGGDEGAVVEALEILVEGARAAIAMFRGGDRDSSARSASRVDPADWPSKPGE